MRKVSFGLGAIAAICALAVPASALATQTLTITPSITGKLGGPGKVNFAFTITSPGGAIPSPLEPGKPFIENNPAGAVTERRRLPDLPRCDGPGGNARQRAALSGRFAGRYRLVHRPGSARHLYAQRGRAVSAYLTAANPVALGVLGRRHHADRQLGDLARHVLDCLQARMATRWTTT